MKNQTIEPKRFTGGRLKIDPDIQIAVAEEFCNRLDKGEHLFDLVVGWVVPEMERRQQERNIGSAKGRN